MKEVNIYIKESCDSLNTKDGYYIAVMTTYGGKCKFSNSFSDTTNYRMIIQGAIDAIARLNQPCIINLFTNTTFGMSKIRKSDGTWRDYIKSSVNTELLNELKALILEGGHEVYNFYNKELVDEALEMYDSDDNCNHVVIKLNNDVYGKLLNKCKQAGMNIDEFIEQMISEYFVS